MGLREWTDEKLSGSTSDDLSGRLAKGSVESAQALVGSTPHAILSVAFIWALPPDVSVTLLDVQIGGGMSPKTTMLLMLLVLSHRKYTEITCNYP